MIHLVYGGSGSGKSEHAENLVMKINSKNKYYFATMKTESKEGMNRIQRHRELRKGKGFITIERETFELNDEIKNKIINKNSTVLVECVSNLVANEMFNNERTISKEIVIKKIFSDFEKFMNVSENIVVVSNNVFEDGIKYDENTENYIKVLAAVNIFIAKKSDKITEVVCGIPLELK